MLVIEAGMDWDAIGESMTLPRLAALSRYWEDVPPLGVLVLRIAQALGFEWRGGEAARNEEASTEDAMRDFAAAGVAIGGR